MNFELPIKKIGTVPVPMLERALQGMLDYEKQNQYQFEFEDWRRLDSYNNPQNIQLADIAGQLLIDHVMSHFHNHVLYGWSLSYLPGKTRVVDHVDRMMLHRLAQRIIVPVNNVPDVLNWHYERDRITKRFYTLDYGNIYRLNTAATHGLENFNEQARRAVYFDVMPVRLYEKFQDNFEIQKVILLKSTGVIHVL